MAKDETLVGEIQLIVGAVGRTILYLLLLLNLGQLQELLLLLVRQLLLLLLQVGKVAQLLGLEDHSVHTVDRPALLVVVLEKLLTAHRRGHNV